MSFFHQFPKIDYDFFNRGVNYQITDFFRHVNVDYAFLDDISAYAFYQVRNGERPDVVSMRLYGTPQYYWTFFVINDHLKSGIANWPLSQEAFEDYIRIEYNGYAINSRVQIIIDSAGEKLYTNTLADEFPIGTRVSATYSDGINSSINSSGTIYARNPQLSQLVIKDVTQDPTVTEPGPLFVNNGKIVSENDEITIQSWLDYRNATHHFEDADGNTVYNSYFFDSSESTPLAPQNLTNVTNFEYETSLNDARSDIRVIRPELIQQFANRYRTLINAN